VPRLSNKQYLNQRVFLAKTRRGVSDAFSRLTHTKQREILDYFQPNQELTDAQALEHRSIVTNARPSLPHRAGKHFRELSTRTNDVIRRPEAQARRTKIGTTSDVRIRGLAKPEPDARMIAHALMKLARDMQEKEVG
jgi:hypothetical protein